jgi:F-type H+-transporting ATPase subunit delta
MAEPATIARPYAEAAFRLAQEQNDLPVWSEMLRLVSSVVGTPEMALALDSPRLSSAEKESLLLSVVGEKLDSYGRNFVRVLIEGDRVGVLPYIASGFEELRNNAEGVANALIETAFPLSDGQLADLKSSLERRFGKKIETSVEVEPALIGGARITVGDTVIDGSVQAKLDAMANRLRA